MAEAWFWKVADEQGDGIPWWTPDSELAARAANEPGHRLTIVTLDALRMEAPDG